MKRILVPLLGLSAGLVLLGGLGVMFQGRGTVGKLLADEPDPLADADGDLLPDLLERVLRTNPLMADTDGDRVPDFVEVVTYSDPRVPSASLPLDVAFRVLCFSNTEQVGGVPTSVLYINHLMMIPSGRPEDLQNMAFFLDIGGLRIDSTDVMLAFSRNVATRMEPGYGLLARITTRIPLDPVVSQVLPATFGAYAQVLGRIMGAGGLLAVRGGVLTALLPQSVPGMETTAFYFAPLNADDTVNNPFWSRNRLCVLELSIEGIRPGGQLCEVRSADCQPSDEDNCSVDCRAAVGGVIFLPDGLSILRGG